MRIVIDGKIGEEDLVLFARFLREMWRHRPDNLFVYIEHGMEYMTSDECQELFRQIFNGDKDWHVGKIDKEKEKEFWMRMMQNG